MFPLFRASALPPWRRSSFGDSHGVTTSAISSDSSMPTEALIGIGRMYGPISPDEGHRHSAAITVKVARMVGPPTSSTAGGIASRSPLPPMAMAVDVSHHHDGIVDGMPMKDQREQRHAVEVKPATCDANSVTASVSTTALPTRTASRQPARQHQQLPPRRWRRPVVDQLPRLVGGGPP